MPGGLVPGTPCQESRSASLAYRVQTDNLLERTGVLRAGRSVVAAWSFLVADLVAWRRRPGNGIGPAHGRDVLRLLARPLESYVNAIV